MIIPVKCFTCGNVLADKYLYYVKEVRKIKISKGLNTEEVIYLDMSFEEASKFIVSAGTSEIDAK